MPRRKQVTPGSIFVRKGTNKLYVNYKGRQHATGYTDSPQGRKLALLYLERLHDATVSGRIPSDRPFMTIAEAYLQFTEAHLRHKSPKTQQSYEYAFRTIITDGDCVLDTRNIKRQIQEYLSHTAHGINARSVLLRSLRVFCRWCNEQELCEHVSFKGLIQTESKPIKTYTRDEIKTVLAEIEKHYDRRYAILFRFIAASGARLTETLDLRRTDDKGDVLIFTNKVNKSKYDMIPVTDELRSIITTAYKLNKGATTIFGYDRTQVRWITRVWERSCEATGVEHHGIHALRKTYTTELIEAGVSIVHVKELLRHKDIRTTTEYYKQYRAASLKSIVEQVRPK
ncbi:MAG: tyrosine-type recombinase/integrase [Candidatus Kapabacteria bacterium]|nr:tyrosine-type recombinase/integrase [Candidatus Kapabacteria bacterium]